MADWQHGVCGCFDNLTVCIVTYFAPCYTAGKNAEKVGDSCLLCGLVTFVPLLNIICQAQTRGKIREQKGIEGGMIGDLLMHCCCPCCALSQEAQEVNALDGMSIDRQ